MAGTTTPQLVTITPLDALDGFSIFFDASLNEVHENTLELTDHPIERGAVVSDHVVRTPITLVIEAILTDYPLDGKQENSGLGGRIRPGSSGSPAQAHIKGLPSGLAASALNLLPEVGAVTSVLTGSVVPGIAANAAGNIANRVISPPTVEVTPGSPSTPPSFPQVIDSELAQSAGYEGRAFELYKRLRDFQKGVVLLRVVTAFQTYDNFVIIGLSAPRDKSINRRAVRFTITMREVQIADAQTVAIVTSSRGQGTAKKGPQSPKPAEASARDIAKAMWDAFGYSTPNSGLTPGLLR